MHRPPRRRRSVGRSIGVVTHHDDTGVTRPNVMRPIALACLIALVCLLPGVAHAQTTQDQLTQLRKSIDATAQRWFDAHNRATTLDARIAALEQSITAMDAQVAIAHKVATARALLIYTGASLDYTSVFGTTVIESARRAELIDHANAQNIDAIEAFTASLKELRSQHDDLVTSRARLDKVLRDVASQRDALDSQLASLQSQAAHDAAQAAGRAASHRVRSAPLSAAPPTAAPTAPAPATFVAQPPAPPPSSGGGVSPHHDDPFLVCTRARESGGNYGVVSSGGTYYGAYQFLPSTWNAIAAHAGRMYLVGVLPSNASAYDQDEMAWALYEWQGKGPWGGRC